MHLSDFDFSLPPELIAQQPLDHRSASRLLVIDPNTADTPFTDNQFDALPAYLEPGDLLVFNNSKVIPARLYAHKTTGGKIEILIERLVDEHRALCHVRSNGRLALGQRLILTDHSTATLKGRHANLFELDFDTDQPLLNRLHAIGHIPLPPYIRRNDHSTDALRYQTVYAEKPGSVAAPTAGLHFDHELLARLTTKGVQHTFVTLHIGAGTFAPVKTDNIHEHTMHREFAVIDQSSCDLIRQTQARGKRVIAVGTTSLRVLESASVSGTVQPMAADTQIFITPGFKFRCVDALITNFHLPKSTLFMLVAAFSGLSLMQQAYAHAIRERYRFFSYGDACFLRRQRTEDR